MGYYHMISDSLSAFTDWHVHLQEGLAAFTEVSQRRAGQLYRH